MVRRMAMAGGRTAKEILMKEIGETTRRMEKVNICGLMETDM